MNPLLRPAFYVPAMMYPRLTAYPTALEARDNRSFAVKGRLRPGVSMAEAQAELNGFAPAAGTSLSRHEQEAEYGFANGAPSEDRSGPD
jgi:hypothetical protein